MIPFIHFSSYISIHLIVENEWKEINWVNECNSWMKIDDGMKFNQSNEMGYNLRYSSSFHHSSKVNLF